MFANDYPYYKYINSPSQMGMSDKGTLQQMAKNVDGLINYVELLVSGGGKASATGRPLGNKYFLQTPAKCTDEKGQLTDRYVYINNIPSGNIPFISSGMGVNFSEFKGLIPGTMSNLNVLNPNTLLKSFTVGSNPPCQSITLETVDTVNKHSIETHYVATADIEEMDPCTFSNGINPVTKVKCKEAFLTEQSDEQRGEQIMSMVAGIAMVYILYKLY